MDWDNLPESRKEEVLGHLYFNRVHEEDWVQYNAFYAADEKSFEEDDSISCSN